MRFALVQHACQPGTRSVEPQLVNARQNCRGGAHRVPEGRVG